MSDTDAESLNTQPVEHIEPRRDEEAAPREKARRQDALHDLRRRLSPDELSTSGVQIMLPDKIDDLHDENYDLRDRLKDESRALREVSQDFHDCRTEAAVLNERLKESPAGDILLAAGSLFLGLVPTLTSLPPLVLVPIIVGTVSMLAGAVWRKIRR